MGSKHRPPKWWKDYGAECAKIDRVLFTYDDGPITRTYFTDGSSEHRDWCTGQWVWFGPVQSIYVDIKLEV
jgi:hypothetical protein